MHYPLALTTTNSEPKQMSTVIHLTNKQNHTMDLKPWEFMRGDNKGKTFFAPKVEADHKNIEQHINFIGVPIVTGIIQRFYKLAGQSAYEDAINTDTGEFDEQKFGILFLDEISNVSMKKGELETAADDYTAELIRLVGQMSKHSPGSDGFTDVKNKMDSITAQLTVTRDAIARKSRKGKDAAEEPAKMAEVS